MSTKTAASRCSLDVEMALRGGCRVKLHAGPGMVKRAGQEDKEVRFILDNDLFMTGNVPINLSAGAMQTFASAGRQPVSGRRYPAAL